MTETNTIFPRDEISFATLVLRLCIGVLLTFAAINKFAMEGPISAWAAGAVSAYDTTYMPRMLVTPFVYALPYVELMLGVLLIIGLYTRASLALASIVFVGITMGTVVKGDYNAATNGAIYVMLSVFSYLLSRWNTFSLDVSLGIQAEDEDIVYETEMHYPTGPEESERKVANIR